MVVSLLSHSTSIHTLTHPLFFNPNHPHPHPHRLPPQFHPPLRRTTLSFSSPKKNSSSSTNNPIPPQKLPRTLFPGGYKRPEIKIPNVILQLSPEEVLKDRTALDSIDGAVSGRVGIVVLNGGAGSGGRLYEAACLLKSVIRDRAYLMIAERVDIAAAVNASGVVLSDQGLPTIVARNTMMDSRSDSVVLPLVARNVQTSDAALNASNSEGADFLIYGIAGEKHAEEPLSSVRESVKVPIFVTIPSLGFDTLFNEAGKYLKSGASGLVVSLEESKLFTDEVLSKLFHTVHPSNKRYVEKFQGSGKLEMLDVDNGFPGKKGVAGFSKLEDRERQLLETEKLVLLEVIDVFREAAPLMEEVSLLIDAVSQLDEPFLLVIVGEFNSGKSSVINALLGKKYLKDGVVPTTNEITFLRFSELESGEQQRCERHPDGQYICFLPAPILKEMIIVDTPGTNVILQRQQRLTEEFVPRADLLLFVISADRPLTESEVTFLRYTQQWKKRVVFVLNKSDLYRNSNELEEAIAFIKENTQRLLNTEHVTLYPVSARSALKAKLSASYYTQKESKELSITEPHWRTNSFYEFEKFLYSFLDGSTSTGIERMKLKLETPIGIAEQLLLACQKIVREKCQHARQDLMLVNDLVDSVKDYTVKMENTSISWKRQTLSLIDSTQARIIKVIESTLQLSNLDLVALYAFKEKSAPMPAAACVRNDIIGPALTDAQKLLGEYTTWLQSSNAHEGMLYKESFEKRWPSLVDLQKQGKLETVELLTRKYEACVKVIENFSAPAASKVFDQEIREVFLSTFGGLGAAGLSASLLTSVLPTTLEDLLALGLCSAGGLLAISNFPARRQKTVDKVKRTAGVLTLELEEAMQKDLLEATQNLENFVKLIGKPYQDLAQRRLDELLKTEEKLTKAEKKLETLRIEIQNLHIPQ
ncbi:probable transmembrane GTPase FZO-like, chloroplastic isoform X1 [Actinidia eriantha]|uniref:probable transmembrane GTPase FZO-like, chloroplastic isoform X1 n=1 Tax=Actinidia eriantha TaxID=165200 RepID=UPI0025860E32|nr:probable transmembrane GTPase FZO-like, chloroplastic isoform X1 [Actinidia eriantha]